MKNAYCIDEDYNITSDDNKRACESASTSNTWVPEVCLLSDTEKNSRSDV